MNIHSPHHETSWLWPFGDKRRIKRLWLAWFIIGVTHVSAIVFLGLLSPLAKDFAFDVGELITTWLPVSSQAKNSTYSFSQEKNSIYSFSKLPILLKEKKIKTPQQPFLTGLNQQVQRSFVL